MVHRKTINAIFIFRLNVSHLVITSHKKDTKLPTTLKLPTPLLFGTVIDLHLNIICQYKVYKRLQGYLGPLIILLHPHMRGFCLKADRPFPDSLCHQVGVLPSCRINDWLTLHKYITRWLNPSVSFKDHYDHTFTTMVDRFLVSGPNFNFINFQPFSQYNIWSSSGVCHHISGVE